MTRTFFAVPIEPTPELRHVARRLELLGKSVRVEPRAQWHVTVKFIGETAEDIVPELKAVCANVVAEVPATTMSLTGLGVFPHVARPQVVWCGLAGSDTLLRLAEQLEAGCESLGIARERRAFHPHLTLARIKSKPPPELRELIEQSHEVEFGTATITRVTLYRSELTPQGSIYTALEEFELSAG